MLLIKSANGFEYCIEYTLRKSVIINYEFDLFINIEIKDGIYLLVMLNFHFISVKVDRGIFIKLRGNTYVVGIVLGNY